MRAKILIVGGGVMGTAIAAEAARRTDPLQEPVVLFERAHLGSGTSGRSGAILRQFYSDREVARMARDSLKAYATFEARTGRSIGFHRTGVLTIAGADQPEGQAKMRANVAMMHELGIDVRLVEADEMRALVPGLVASEGSLGAWESGGGFVDPQRTVDAFGALARSYGAITRVGSPVSEILVRNGRAVGAETAEGTCEAETVMLVTGPWTGSVLQRLGVVVPLRVLRPENHFLATPAHTNPTAGPEAGERPPLEGGMRSLRGESVRASSGAAGFEGERLVAFVADMTGGSRTAPHPVLIDLEHGFYCRCEPETGRTRVGHVDYDHDAVLERPEDLAEKVSDTTRRWSRSALASRIPEYADRPDAGSIACWYTLTPDAQAMIGPVPGIENLYVVSGFSGHGFKLAPSVGEGVAQMIFGEPVTAFDPEFFSPTRFQAEAAWSGRFGL